MLSSDVLKLHQSRSPFTAQRRAAAQGVDPRHARVLQLQRDAGNKAVSRMLQGQRSQRAPAIQRELSYRASDLTPHMRALTGTYAKLVRALRDFHGASDPQAKVATAAAIVGLADTWLQDHAAPQAGRWRARKGILGSALLGGREDAQRAIVTRLRAEARREHAKLRDDAAYLARMRSGGFTGMSKTTHLAADAPARALASGQTLAKPYEGADAAALDVVRKYKLTEAEIAAIRIFTVSDYAYINPAKAGSDSWLKSGVLGSKDEEFKGKFGPKPYAGDDPWSQSNLGQLKAEGDAHAAKLMEAVGKLQAHTEPVFRGTRMTFDDFKRKCANGAQFPFSSFGSTSKQRSIAQGYADGTRGDVRPPGDADVSVLFVLDMKNGRDISKVSASMKPEDEVLILPGSVFVVDRKVPSPTGNPGQPKATKWWTVYLRQVR